MIDRFRNDEKQTWNQAKLANSESCVMTHSKGCHGSAGMHSFRHDGVFLRRDAPQYKCYTKVRHDGDFLRRDAPKYKCYTTVRHDGSFLRRDAPQYKCCTRCVVTEDIVRRDGGLYKCYSVRAS